MRSLRWPIDATLAGSDRRLPSLVAVLFAALAIPVPQTFAQAVDLGDPRKALTQYKLDGWQTEQGLPLNTVQCMLHARDGSLWVGTGGGLARFDGVRFTTYETSEVPEVPSQPIFGLMEDKEGTLWIGHSKGAALYRGGRFEVAFPAEITSGRRVWAFVQDEAKVVWAATENGLVRWDKGAIRVYKMADGLPTNRLRSLAFDSEGTLWIGTTGGGLVSFVEGEFAVMDPSSGFPHLEVRFVLPDPGGGIWAATAGAGLVHVTSRRGTARIRTYTVTDGLPTDQLSALALDAQGSLWIGTWGGGVSRLSEGHFTSISSEGGLSGDQIWSIYADREGSIWVGTWVGGLNRFSNRAFVVFGAPEGLSHDNVRAVMHARDGSAWVTTAGGGVNRIEGGRVTRIQRKDGLPSNETSTILEDQDGSVWVGTYGAGLAHLRGRRLDTYTKAHGLPTNDVRALYQDRAGVLWVGTTSGVARLSGQRFVPFDNERGPLEGVSVILEDRSGSLWFGTAGDGLVRYRDGGFETLTRQDGLVSNWIMSLHEDEAGVLWIGTNGEGMNRLKDGQIASIRDVDGLWDNVVQTIVEDRLGYLWITCNRGFFRVSRAELTAFADGRVNRIASESFGPGDALRSTTFAGGHQGAGGIDAAGHVWLPSFNGLVIVDPSSLPGSSDPPAVTLGEFVVNGRPEPKGGQIVLPPGSAPLTIRYAATTLLNAERARFRYRMDGLTQDWVDAGKNREASFSALPPGKYQFQVEASTDGKRWSRVPASVPVTVTPRLYQTGWFMALASVGGLAFVGCLFRLRTHQLRSRHDEMGRLVAEKTEELRLANEHLSRLSFLDSLTGLANRRRFDETLENEWRRGIRARTPLSVVMVDIDHFKPYNDSLGHPEGDRCLTAVAEVISNSVGRAGDLAARYGGEEFVVLIPAADRNAALAFGERLRQACEARAIPHPASPAGAVITISVGVSTRIPSDETTAASLVEEADAALYKAKQEGRNRVR